MRKILIILLFSLGVGLNAQNTYYVATTGSDGAAGTIGALWATWQKAFTTANAGDTVYFRGGVYTSVGDDNYPRIDPYGYYPPARGHSGNAAHWISFFAYPGETPILDCSGQISTASSIVKGIVLYMCQYIHFKGLTIQNVFQRGTTKMPQGVTLNYSANIKFERCTFRNISGRGVYGSGFIGYYNSTWTPVTVTEDTTTFYRCDFYNLCDSTSAHPGNAADGIKYTHNGRWISATQYDTLHTLPNAYFLVKECRFWNFSDDGNDIGGTMVVENNSNWSNPSTKYNDLGDMEKNGFKITATVIYAQGRTDSAWTGHWRIIKNCLAVNCKGAGFYDLNYVPYHRNNSLFVNNFSYHNRYGFISDVNYSYRPRTSEFYNNIAYQNIDYEAAIYRPSIYPESHNNWDATQKTGDPSWPGWVYTDTVTVTDADFVSLDTTGFAGPRGVNGELPTLSFGHLAGGSDLIGAGVYKGMSAVPDMGVDWAWVITGVAPDPEVDYLATIYSNLVSPYTIRNGTSGGNITSDGGATITDRGICWGTSANPTTANSHVHIAGTTGSFSATLTGLSANTTYHMRAFATNSVGTAYGIDIQFKTPIYSPGKSGAKIGVSGGKIGVIK